MNLFERKNVYYELKYLSYKFKPHNLLLLLFTLLGSVIVSLSDTQAFFTGETSPIPEKWTFFKKPSNARVVSVLVIVIPALSIFITEGINKMLIRQNNLGYLILPIFDNNFLSGLLVIDTDNSNDLTHLQNTDMHEDIFNWIGSEPIFLTLIWKLSNYGNK